MFKRRKYDYRFRLRCVEALLAGKGSLKSVAKRNGIETSNLRLWLSFYQVYGRPGLQARSRRQYDLVFKLKVLKAMDATPLSLREACVRFNVPSESVIISWRRAYETQGEAGLIAKRKGRPPQMKPSIKRKTKTAHPLTREEELLKENEYLRAENDLLKKLQALAQSAKKQKP